MGHKGATTRSVRPAPGQAPSARDDYSSTQTSLSVRSGPAAGCRKVLGCIYNGQEGASVRPCACVFPRFLCPGVGAALPTDDALDHHGRDATL